MLEPDRQGPTWCCGWFQLPKILFIGSSKPTSRVLLACHRRNLICLLEGNRTHLIVLPNQILLYRLLVRSECQILNPLSFFLDLGGVKGVTWCHEQDGQIGWRLPPSAFQHPLHLSQATTVAWPALSEKDYRRQCHAMFHKVFSKHILKSVFEVTVSTVRSKISSFSYLYS